MTRKVFNVLSTDGVHTLSGVIYLPMGKPKGLFHIVHGMAEYTDRYAPLMTFLAGAGYIVFGYDHLGHGKTVDSPDELGFIAPKNGWRLLVDDVVAFENAVCREYPDLPLILMGHSMGSFIVRLAEERISDRLSGLIVCGTGGPNPAAPAGLLICDILRGIYGEKHISNFLEKMAFGAYNKRFPNNSKYNWLTKDADVVAAYEQDPLCGFPFTASALHDLVKLNQQCNRRGWFRRFSKDLPVLLISGEEDPVGDYGKGVKTVYDRLRNHGVVGAELQLYANCRHEIHNDSCRSQMFERIFEFCDRRIKK